MADFKYGSPRKKEYLLQEYIKSKYGLEAISMFMVLSFAEMEVLFLRLQALEKDIPNGPFKTFLRKNKGHEFIKG